ncbi:YlaC family protein [Biostraticola tofi]|uniref:Inner membrane protein YlaC n=1 Tax=Biostraticola tofi TaxID=466109 RepID=A0A4R3YZC2_9GAMM|nr:YlaC family protein [Biostraticola tofi]TCV96753.1 inner membrane protein YlaC [Biostraticola tofi]
MNTVTKIVNDELDYLNTTEHRSHRIRLDASFIREKKALYALMCILFALTIGLLSYSSIFSRIDLYICIVIFVLLNGFFIFNIKPPYKLTDVNRTLLMICYTGEWYREVPVRQECIDRVLSSGDVTTAQKEELLRLMKRKEAIYFEDLIDLEKI